MHRSVGPSRVGSRESSELGSGRLHKLGDKARTIDDGARCAAMHGVLRPSSAQTPTSWTTYQVTWEVRLYRAIHHRTLPERMTHDIASSIVIVGEEEPAGEDDVDDYTAIVDPITTILLHCGWHMETHCRGICKRPSTFFERVQPTKKTMTTHFIKLGSLRVLAPGYLRSIGSAMSRR